jgi:tetratricopeptide (TPR) repeat protein
LQRAAVLTCLLAILARLTSPAARAQEPPLTDPLDTRVADCTRSMDGECLLALADFAAAADAFARFAHEHREDPQAPVAQARAVELWRELGQPERVLDTAREFRQMFPKHPRLADVAEEVFLLGELHQQRAEAEREARHHELYLKEWSKVGGADREIVAHVRLAAFLLEKSCPVAGVRGACIESRQVPFKCSEAGVPVEFKAKQPTNLMNELVIRHRRDLDLVKKAEEHLTAAKRLAAKAKAEEQGRGRTGRLARRNDLADAIAESVLLAVHDARDEFLGMQAPPSGLHFEPPTQFESAAVVERKKWVFEESQRRFLEWLRAKTRLSKLLQDAAHKAMSEFGPASVVHAAGLLAEVQASLSTLTEDREHLHECRPDGFICGGSGDWILEENTDIAVAACATLADGVPADDEWARFCQPRGGVSRRRVFGQVVHPTPTRQQSEVIQGLRLEEATTTPDAIGGKPRQNPVSEMRLDRFSPRPFPGHRKAEGQRGSKTLKMSEGSEFASLFARQTSLDNAILDRLAAQAGPFSLPNRASIVRLTILGARRECYYPLPSTLFVETAGNHIIKLDSPETGTNIACLEKAAKALALPKTYFKGEQALWRIDL